MSKKESIKNFIKDNELLFTEGRRNSDSTILAGYALHIEVLTAAFVNEILNEVINDYNYNSEFTKVFHFAKTHHYEVFWLSRDAKKQYKF